MENLEEKKQEYLKKFIEENRNKMNDITIDFLGSYDVEDLQNWIDDKINEFADSEVEIYYSDLDKFASEHNDIINEHWEELKDTKNYYDMLMYANYFYNQELLYQDNCYISKYVENWEV